MCVVTAHCKHWRVHSFDVAVFPKIPTAIKWNSEYTLKMGDNAPESGRTVWFDGKKWTSAYCRNCRGKTFCRRGFEKRLEEEEIYSAHMISLNMRKQYRRVFIWKVISDSSSSSSSSSCSSSSSNDIMLLSLLLLSLTQVATYGR